MVDVPVHRLFDSIDYMNHPDHRNGTPNKSQWSVTEEEERNIFIRTWTSHWVVADAGWGLYLVNDAIAFLGVAQDHATPVFIAKFIGNNSMHDWHGFPVDHRRQSDRPAEAVLGAWLAAAIIPAAKIRKIQKVQPCRL